MADINNNLQPLIEIKFSSTSTCNNKRSLYGLFICFYSHDKLGKFLPSRWSRSVPFL